MSNRTHIVSSLIHASGLASLALAALALGGCASGSHTEVPANARVDIMQTDKMVLHGTADASLASPNCKTDALPAKHLVELKDDLAGHIILRPAGAEPAPRLAVLHVTQLDTNRTWCVQTSSDGTTATIPGEFPMGVYAISVTEARSATPHKYEVVVEKL